jgi:predicted nucleic-acid-binding protein
VIALDTSVVIRTLTGDVPAQLEIARGVLRSPSLFVAKTVLLETEWVLRYSYEFGREAIASGLRRLIAYRNLEVEDLEAVTAALSWYAGGMDFADALHLASSKRAERLVTFDRKLAASAAALGYAPRVELLRS